MKSLLLFPSALLVTGLACAGLTAGDKAGKPAAQAATAANPSDTGSHCCYVRTSWRASVTRASLLQ